MELLLLYELQKQKNTVHPCSILYSLSHKFILLLEFDFLPTRLHFKKGFHLFPLL
ncbi:unnamed protein product [Tenebrio molitor]|nr:unnamed protein product [Tenebrio molitor]